jgi:magnesium transporter
MKPRDGQARSLQENLFQARLDQQLDPKQPLRLSESLRATNRMITIYRNTEAGLETVERLTKWCWIKVTNPTQDEARNLVRDLSIPAEFVNYSLNPAKIPLVEKSDSAILVLVRISHFQSATASIPYVTLPMGIILTNEHVITICRQEHNLLRDLPHEHQAYLSIATPSRFVLHLLWSVASNYLSHLNEINNTVEEIEERLQRSLQNRDVLELLRYQKSLAHFITALNANETMFERLQRGEFLEMKQRDQDLLNDVSTENRQAIGMSEIASNILSQMVDAFASIISNNLNVTMKFLASVTVILIIPTIIGGFFGMNVPVPLHEHWAAFPALIILSILGAFIVGLIFWKKKWL